MWRVPEVLASDIRACPFRRPITRASLAWSPLPPQPLGGAARTDDIAASHRCAAASSDPSTSPVACNRATACFSSTPYRTSCARASTSSRTKPPTPDGIGRT